ncbi:serine hydrolase domain-containing protein [Dyadobacter sp. MSC1_007]|jgi:CubicO group peptidase (beta-lactamase class C family)|uniref:serine hydrolase domain-containing protein n=1 Tax=Dyadobacter sp. MSC1_007 TaxID=2909264 RepID=UPI00202F0000|nr:serine hydrolase domain-containing protein [Dyadobacter sp. MSC1_007]
MKTLKGKEFLGPVLLISILLFSNFSQTAYISQPRNHNLEQQVNLLVEPLIDSSIAAGAIVGVMRNDSILLIKSYGMADVELNAPLSQDASFEIGSTTKQFTAAAVMQLVERGLIQLNDPVNKYINFNSKPHQVTIEQLLNHTSGIKPPPRNEYLSIIRSNYPRDTLLRLLENGGFNFEPGTAMNYSNMGYFILGQLIEKVSGKDYETYLEENILSKAKMTNTYYSDAETVRKERAHGYNNLQNKNILTRAELPYYRWTYSAGALSSTVKDLLAWNKALHNSEHIVSKKIYNQFITPGQLKDGSALRYANGLQILTYKGHRMIGHGGSGSGFLSQICYFPDEKLTIVTMQNTYRPVSEADLAYAIADKILPAKKDNLPVEPVKDLSIFRGTYKGALEINVEVAGNQLVIRRLGQKDWDTLTYMGNGRWSLKNDFYSFGIKDGQVKELYWDAIYAFLPLHKSN